MDLAVVRSSLRVAVIGGSLGGLFAGIALRSAGADVRIFEKSSGNLQHRGAGIVLQPDVAHFLSTHGIASPDQIAVRSQSRQFFERDGSCIHKETYPQHMTSWDALYSTLRGHFPSESYIENAKIDSVSFDSSAGRASKTVLGPGHERYECDLVIAADGADSTIRRQLFPDKSFVSYSGYVAWRGVIEEAALSSRLHSLLADNFSFYLGQGTQMLCYFIPGANGNVSHGSRRVNWVWYWNVPEGSELTDLLTDKNGKVRANSVPPGLLNEKHIQRQLEIARRELPSVFQELFETTPEYFVQAILDYVAPRMHVDGVCLIGDAAVVVRPHTAASTAKACADATTLAQAVDRAIASLSDQSPAVDVQQAFLEKLQSNLDIWDQQQLKFATALSARGKMLGDHSQFPQWAV